MELEHYLNLLCVEASGQAAAASLCIQTQVFPRVPASHRLHCVHSPALESTIRYASSNTEQQGG